MVEWSITAVLKTAVLRGTGGSNPSLSAKPNLQNSKLGFFIVRIVRNKIRCHYCLFLCEPIMNIYYQAILPLLFKTVHYQ